jgi:hypothetical protein
LKDIKYRNANNNNFDYVNTQVLFTKDGNRVAINVRRQDVTANNFWAFYDDSGSTFEYANQPISENKAQATKVVPAGTSISMTTDGKIFASSESKCSGSNSNVEYARNSICLQTTQVQGPDMDQLKGDEVGRGTSWGTSVSLTAKGNYVAVGTSDGRVFVYKVFQLITSNSLDVARYGSPIVVDNVSSNLGEVVKMAASEVFMTVAVGGRSQNNQNAIIRVYLFNPIGNNWGQKGSDIDAGSDGTRFEISRTGDVVAVVFGQNEVRVFEYIPSDNDWVERGGDLSVPPNHYASISLSDEGDILAIGIYRGNLTGGENQNKVIVYEYSKAEDNWNVISMELVENDNIGVVDFGSSVSLSADRSSIAVAAPAFPNRKSDLGFVAVYDARESIPTGQPTEFPTRKPSPKPTEAPTVSPKPSQSPTVSPIPTLLPTFLPTPSTCISNCSCKAGRNCDLSACTINCNCPGGGCDMSNCTRDCRCKGGNCNMKRCQSNCQCEGRNCQMDNCLYNGRCASGGSSIRGSNGIVKGGILVTSLMSFLLLVF